MAVSEFYQHFFELLDSQTPFVCVTLVQGLGSIPQEPGAKMLVTPQGLHIGTIGGGKVEQKALAEAQSLLDGDVGSTLIRCLDWNLNTDVGMTCGGSVRLLFEAYNRGIWQIVVYGAGHVAQALIPILLTLDCQVTCIDTRQEWLDKLPTSAKLSTICTDDMSSTVGSLPKNAFVALMTMGHSTDSPILLEILRTRQFPYLGAIGSRSKALQFKKDIQSAGLPEECQSAFHCPIGLDVGDNEPAEIAISITAQLLQVRDKIIGVASPVT
jgi:xanthine dehydrogenase accessory factor